MAWLRTLLARRGDDTGASLVELLVVVGLLAGIFAMTAMLYSATARSARHAQSETQDSQVTRASLDAMSKLVRTAVPRNTSTSTPAFVTAGPSEVTFYSNLDTTDCATCIEPPIKVHLYVDWTKRELIEERTTATVSAGSDPFVWLSANTRSRVLARDLVSPQPHAIFTYLTDGDTTTSSLDTGADGNIVSEDLGKIRSVELWLTVRSDTSDAPATSLATRIFLPNTGDPDAVLEGSTS